MNSRPNLVFFIPDQLRADAVGSFGNPHVSTPNVDALAARGTRFTQTFVQHPVCSPSRASFLTGWYPHTAGHRTLTHLLRPWEPNLLRILKEAGYHVTWAGARGDTFAPGATELSVHEYGFSIPPNQLADIDAGYGEDIWARLFYRGRVPDDGRVDNDEAIIRGARRWLADPPPQPWVLFVPILAPHCPFEVPEPWFSHYDRDALPNPVPPDTTREPRYMQEFRERHGTHRVTAAMWREVKATYYGMISRMDEQFGRLMSTLDSYAAGTNTITLFFSDHGEYLGDYGLIEKWPSALHDCIVRDPLIISGSDLPRGQVCDAMVELIDVLPTVLDLASVPAPHHHYGRSLVPLLRAPSTEHRRYAFTEGGFTVEEEPQLERAGFPYDLKTAMQHEDPSLVGKAFAVRDREWTYVWRLYEQPELYQRAVDPAERVNLAGSPAHADIQRRMNEALLRWLAETADIIPRAEDPRLPTVALPPPGAGKSASGATEST